MNRISDRYKVIQFNELDTNDCYNCEAFSQFIENKYLGICKHFLLPITCHKSAKQRCHCGIDAVTRYEPRTSKPHMKMVGFMDENKERYLEMVAAAAAKTAEDQA